MSYCLEVYSVSLMAFINIFNCIFLYYGTHFLNIYDFEVMKYHYIHSYIIYTTAISSVYIVISGVMLVLYICVKEKQKYQGRLYRRRLDSDDTYNSNNNNNGAVYKNVSPFENDYLLVEQNITDINEEKRKVNKYMIKIYILFIIYTVIDIVDFGYSLYHFNKMDSVESNYYQQDYKKCWMFFSNRVYYLCALSAFMAIHFVVYYICR